MSARLAILALVIATVSTSESAVATSHGLASYYGYRDGYTGRTASGEHVRVGAFTAAHRTLPFGTRVRVTNTGTGRSVVVRINDRGPFVRGRIIDVSHSAAQALGMIGRGVAAVQIEVVR
jgi:rare lipoprotein A